MHSKITEDIQHIRMIIHGDFTSGGFAFTVLFLANKTGIKGYIKYINLTMLEIEAEGTLEQLTEFSGECKKEHSVLEINSSAGIIKNFKDFNLINNLKF